MGKFDHITEMKNLRECLEICEWENSNLRKLLLEAAIHMPVPARRDLLTKLKAGIDNGGASHASEEASVENKARDRVINRVCDHLDTAAQTPGMPSRVWYAQGSELANQLRGFLSPFSETESTLADIDDVLVGKGN